MSCQLSQSAEQDELAHLVHHRMHLRLCSGLPVLQLLRSKPQPSTVFCHSELLELSRCTTWIIGCG